MAVWAFSSICLAALSGGMGNVNAMSINQEGMGCDTEKSMESNLQCCLNREQPQNVAVNLVQLQPLLIVSPIVKVANYPENYIDIFKPSFRVSNTSGPPRNLPGIIVKKE